MNREDNLQIIENSVSQETYKKIVSRNYSDDVLNYISGYGPTIEVFADTKYKTETVHKLADALSNHRISTYDMMDIMKSSVNSAKNEPYTDNFIRNIGITNFRENMAAFLTSNTADVSYNDIISGLSSGIYEENTVGRLQINDMLASEMRKAGINLTVESYEDVNYTPVQKHILCERINYMRKSPDWEEVRKSFAEPIISENFDDMIILDTETTGLSPSYDELLQVSIINGKGEVLFDSYFKPNAASWDEAQAVNHISPEMVKNSPRLNEKAYEISQILDKAHKIVGYNVDFDLDFLWLNGAGGSNDNFKKVDVMQMFAPIYGEINEKYGGYKWQKLTKAADYYGYDWDSHAESAHNSLGDCYATLHVYKSVLSDLKKKEIFSEYCKPLDSDDDLSGKLLILTPEALNEDNQNKAMLFFYAEGAVPSVVDGRPMIVSGKYLADDLRARYDLDDILGIADRDKLPAWAEKKLRTLEKEQLEINAEMKQTAYDENMAAYRYINGLDDHDEPSEQDDDDYSYENLSHSIFLDEIKDQYADFRDNTLRMTAKDIFAAAYEITAKTAIKEKLVNEDVMLSDEQETALMQSDNMIDEIYQDWLKKDSEDFADLPTVIVNTAEYRHLCSNLKKQNINDSAVVYEEETDDTPAVSTCRRR